MVKEEGKFRAWLGRLGFAGLLFFTVKGLLWLIVPALLVWLGVTMGE